MVPTGSPLDHVTPYDRLAWSDAQIEAMLASGQYVRELSAYFGVAEQRALAALARRAQATAVDAALKVLVVPGIMGSQLGLKRAAPLPHDIVWLDPIDIQLGRLASLRLPGVAPIVPLGVVMFSYLRLKLYLRAHGFAAEFHDYDWRLPVAQLGTALAERVRAAGSRVAIVAHSMGGLLTRVALAAAGTGHVERVVLLGTPHCGSFAAVQAMRGTYAVVRKVARLITRASAESLAGEVFSSFPSLYDMLPSGADEPAIDLFDPGAWPTTGPQPRPELMRAARAARQQLAPADPRFTNIVGVDQETVTSVTRRDDDFVYTLTRHGDGTVPAASAALPQARCAYARVAHSNLTRDPQVCAAVVDLLRGGATRLPDVWNSDNRACAQVSDQQLRRSHAKKVDWAALKPEERRLFLQNLNEPPKYTLRVPGAIRRPRKHP
jgi:pimeloyl-ACP methyl ester carboxylesterase